MIREFGLRNLESHRRVLGDDKDTLHLVPKWEDLDILECIDKAIRPLKEYTDIMSASKYVTVSALKPILHRLSTTELARQDGDLPLVVEIKEEVLIEKAQITLCRSFDGDLNECCILFGSEI